MAQNGRTSFILPDSESREPAGSNGAAQLHDAARRRNRLIRRESIRREAAAFTVGVLEAAGYKKDDIERAAQYLCDSIKVGRTSLSQVQHEQIEDANRLTGWRAVGNPEAGSPSAERIAAIQRRMAVRNRALELHLIYDVHSATDQSRPQTVPSQPTWKPWRKGAGPSAREY